MAKVAGVFVSFHIDPLQQRPLNNDEGILIIPALNIFVKGEPRPLAVVAMQADTSTCDGTPFLPAVGDQHVAR